MRVCVAVVCLWGVVIGLPPSTTPPPPHTTPLLSQAQDCVPYGDAPNQEAPSKRFQRRVTVEVTPPAGSPSYTAGKLILESLTTSRKCNLMLLGNMAAVSCSGGHGEGGQELGGQGVGGHGLSGQGVGVQGLSGQGNGGQQVQNWPMDILAQGEYTELWVQVGGTPGAPPDTLVVVGRRAGHQGRLVLPSSGLLPPITLTTTKLHHYYNCVTGCKYGRTTKTQPGDDKVYLRTDPTFLKLSLAYTPERRDQVYLNLTSDDLGKEAGSSEVREVKVFWNGELGTIGATVDGQRVGENGRWIRLDRKQEVEAKVEGGGMVAACDLTFLGPVDVQQCESDRGESDHGESDHGESDHGESDQGESDHGESDHGESDHGESDHVKSFRNESDHVKSFRNENTSSGVMVALGIMAILALIFLTSTIIFAILNHRASRKLRIITGASIRVPKRGSTRKRETNVDDEDRRSVSEVTAALSDTVSTPAHTPGSLSVPRAPVMVSSKDFVSLDLM